MTRRASRFSRGRKKSKVFEIDITSLLDILTILLIFLIQSHNFTGAVTGIPKDIHPPHSSSKIVSTVGVNIQVSKTQIFVDAAEVVNTDIPESQLYDEGGKRIVPLYNELVKIKETIHVTEKLSPMAQKFSGVANLIIDKSLKYSYLKRIMHTCAAAGFKEFKFVVLSNGK